MKENKKMGTNIEQNMPISVFEDGRGRKCVYMFRYAYAGI